MRKTINLLIRIFFIIIVLFLLLGFKNVFCFEQEYDDKNFYIPDDLIEKVKTLDEYGNDDYYIVYSREFWNQNLFAVAFVPRHIKVFYYHNDSQGPNRATLLYSSDTDYHGIVFYNFNVQTLEQTYKSTDRYYQFSYMDFFIDSSGIYWLYSNEPIYSSLPGTNQIDVNTIFFNPGPVFKNPSFSNSIDSFKTNSFKNFIISPGDLSPTDQLEFTIRNDDSYYEIPDTIIDGYEEINTFILDNTSPYFKTIQDSSGFYYEIPKSDLTFTINDNNQYTLLLFWDKPELLYKELSFTVGILSDEEILLTDVNNTNKNIFQKIGDIFNLLNPFHENFFGRKLVELIIDGLKSLFIPENEYFSNYFDELNNWFSDRLGFLYYPLDVLFDLLNRFLSLSSENLVINIPEIKEPTTDTVLIKNQTFDFNTLLENEVLKNLHNIYLIIVDAIICFGVVNLLYKKYEEVIAKW